MRYVTEPADALALVESGHRVFLHEAAMTPTTLLAALATRARDLHDVETVSLHTEGPAPHVAPELEGHLRHNALFVGANVRDAVNDGRADATPVFLSEVPALFRNGSLPIDVALVRVSPPDAHGYCRLGVSAAAARAAVDHARIVIAEVSDEVPRALGHTALHESRIAIAIRTSTPLYEHGCTAPGDVERAIGRYVASEIPNGATIQTGIGAIPDAVLDALADHRDLGVHTEMFSDGVLALAKRGVINGARKSRFRNRIVASFVVGSRTLYEFCDENPEVELHPSDVVNDFDEIAAQHAMMAINSAIAIDLTGQVCADSIGDRIWSGIGGQMDFVRGAVASKGGKAFIALPSTARGGTVSRIVPRLEPGSGVVTTRGHVQWVVTEHGAVDLRGRSLRERAELLISIADPAFRSELRAAAVARKLVALR